MLYDTERGHALSTERAEIEIVLKEGYYHPPSREKEFMGDFLDFLGELQQEDCKAGVIKIAFRVTASTSVCAYPVALCAAEERPAAVLTTDKDPACAEMTEPDWQDMVKGYAVRLAKSFAQDGMCKVTYTEVEVEVLQQETPNQDKGKGEGR